MTYEMYQTIFWHAGVLTIIFAVGDVLLFVILKIPKVIGQLSGRTARKELQIFGKRIFRPEADVIRAVQKIRILEALQAV